MPRGLVRDNNLSDLGNRDDALINLGISIAAVERIQGVAFPGGVQPTDIQRIAGSSGNFQNQIDGLNRTLNGYDVNIHVSGSYVPRAGGPVSDFIEYLYRFYGRSDGLYTGLWDRFKTDVAKAARAQVSELGLSIEDVLWGLK